MHRLTFHLPSKKSRFLISLIIFCVICYNFTWIHFFVNQFFRQSSDHRPGNSFLLRFQKHKKSPSVKTYHQNDVARRTILIVIYKFGPFLERRHIRRFTNHKFSPWENCSVKSCELSYKDDDLDRAEAVIFHLHKTRSASELPRRRNYKQRWVFLTDETPFNTFLYRNQRLSDYDGLFNWSMTYRTDSDVPVPYGRTVSLNHPKTNYLQLPTKTKLVAIMGSNCGSRNNRWYYVRKLKLILQNEMDIFGRCEGGNTTACPGHFDKDCKLLESYKFYLAFENSNCREYMTEKLFWNSYKKAAVPVIMGAPKADCHRLLPPKSFLHVLDFASPLALADYLKYLNRNEDEYLKYHEWRRDYAIVNEHGYFGSASFHYCRLCEALNHDHGRPKVYNNLSSFWNVETDCDNND